MSVSLERRLWLVTLFIPEGQVVYSRWVLPSAVCGHSPWTSQMASPAGLAGRPGRSRAGLPVRVAGPDGIAGGPGL